jgi:hypothetical protein
MTDIFQSEHEQSRQSVLPYLARGVFFIGLPFAVFFSVFTFFPFSIANPLERVGNMPAYLAVWVLIGCILGYGLWSRHRRKG